MGRRHRSAAPNRVIRDIRKAVDTMPDVDFIEVRCPPGRGHPKLVVGHRGEKYKVTFSKTPSDHRTLRNLVSTIRQAIRQRKG